MDLEDAGPVTWRHLERFLWVAVAPSGCLGTIEQGRRFVVVDTEGRVRGSCRTLEHAQALLLVVSERQRRPRAPQAA